MSLRKFAALSSVLLGGTLAAAGAQAGPQVQWQVSVETPVIRLPGHVVLPLPPILVPRVVVGAPRYEERVHSDRRRHDVDGDGIPDRHDRVYNPRWDRDGDGIPNRQDAYPNDARNGQGWRGDRYEHRRDEWRDERRDERRDDRHDNRRDWRGAHPGR